eukprot:290137-Amphidinium_carterae.1
MQADEEKKVEYHKMYQYLEFLNYHRRRRRTANRKRTTKTNRYYNMSLQYTLSKTTKPKKNQTISQKLQTDKVSANSRPGEHYIPHVIKDKAQNIRHYKGS